MSRDITEDEIELKKIKSIQFGIYSPEVIRKMAVTRITSPKLSYGPGELYDPYMGSLDNNEPCKTCKLKMQCQGHFGYIELNYPVLHPLYYKTICNYLKIFCHNCSRLVISEKSIRLKGLSKYQNHRRFDKIVKHIESESIDCHHCKMQKCKIKLLRDMRIQKEFREGTSTKSLDMNVKMIKSIFDKIPDEDMRLLCIDPDKMHPKNLIFTVFPVIPTCCRPPVFNIGTGGIGDDDLSTQLAEIVKANDNLDPNRQRDQKARTKKDEMSEEKLIEILNNKIAGYYDNTKVKNKGYQGMSNRSINDIKSRISGKDGRIRGTMTGKRVDYSARTVIGAAPHLKMNQVCISKHVATTLTFPEIVTPYNIKKLTDIVNEGKANTIIRQVGSETKRYATKYATVKSRQTELLEGDIIVRGEEELKEDEKGNVILPQELKDNILKTISVVTIENGKFKNQYIIKTLNNEIFLKENDRVIRDGKFIPVTINQKKTIELQIGNVVERHLRDGDWVIFNRQPTLHRGSMLGMEVVVHHGSAKTFSFSPSTCKIFNADFDGDEMNIHAVQSYEALAEVREICNAIYNIMSIKDSKPIISPVQDSLIGMFVMTNGKTHGEREIDFLTKKLNETKDEGERKEILKEINQNVVSLRARFFDLSLYGQRYISYNKYEPLFTKEKGEDIMHVFKKFNSKHTIYSGHALFSLLLPRDFYYECTNEANDDEPTVKIYKGVMYAGTLDKKIIGASATSIIQALYKNYSPQHAANFIDNIQFISNNYNARCAFSVGIEDCLIESKETNDLIQEEIRKCYENAKGIEETTFDADIREMRVIGKLSQATNIGAVIARKAMRKNNNMFISVKSGAKGELFNIMQVTGALGQQFVYNSRIKPVINNSTRVMAHYPFSGMTKEREYESQGFVPTCFIYGLSPQEAFLHSISGRVGIINTSANTSVTGYAQRRLVKILENNQVDMDKVIRNPDGQIISFHYGDDGYDPALLVKADGAQQDMNIELLVNELNCKYIEGQL